MSSPVDPAVDAAIQAQLAAQAETVTGDPAAAGVYGDPAGAAQPPAPLDLSKATATAVDVEALLTQLQDLQARAQAAVDAANPPPPPPDTRLYVDSNAPGWMHSLVAVLEERLSAVEAKLGL